MASNDLANPSEAPRQKSVAAWFKDMHRLMPGYLNQFLIFTFVSNVLMLVSPLYMLQIYDRILTSGSVDTLIWLSLIAIFLMGIFAASEMARRRLCALAAEEIETKMSHQIFRQFDEQVTGGGKLPQNLMVLSRLRSLFQNQLILPFFDIPFAPLFLIILFIIHPVIGALGLIGGAVLLGLAIFAEQKTRDVVQASATVSSQAFELASGLNRQRSAIVAMGLAHNARTKWRNAKQAARELNLKAGAQEGAFASAAKSGRQMLQILILGTGAALAIAQEISPGAIVAGSIIMARALAPVDQITGSWRAIAQARNAWEELAGLNKTEEPQQYTPLPRPAAELKIDRLVVATPGADTPVIHPFGIAFGAGEFVALIGPNGSGKTSLLQTVAGAWPVLSGSVALGGRSIHAWPSEDRGQYIGYVPQDVELLPGTVRENISRMTEAEPEKVIAAAKAAGAHDMILALKAGYETVIGGSGGDRLSAGQRQLIGVARALFGEPVLLLLDEPTANLDPQAAEKLIASICRLRDAGSIVLTATHDAKLIEETSNILAIKNGGVSIAATDQYLKTTGTSKAPISIKTPISKNKHAPKKGAAR